MQSNILNSSRPPSCEFNEIFEATSFCYLEDSVKGEGWFFCGQDHDDQGKYRISINEFIQSKESILWWLMQLAHKPWMNFWDFERMLQRFDSQGGNIKRMDYWIYTYISDYARLHEKRFEPIPN